MEEKVNYQTEEERSIGIADHSSDKVPQGEGKIDTKRSNKWNHLICGLQQCIHIELCNYECTTAKDRNQVKEDAHGCNR